MQETNFQRVIKVAQELLKDALDETGEACSVALVGSAVDETLAFLKRKAEGVNRDDVIAEIIRRMSIWVGEDATLADMTDHEPWLTPALKREWRYWQRYREWQEARLPWAAIEGLDATTDGILGLLENPKREGSWDRRGLVVGHVQSGKTGNYTGLVCKAADAGYKIIIVLAGLHNNLRAQTQMRLDEGFLGYETHPDANQKARPIGVGLIDSDPALRPQFVTNRTETGDFNMRFARNLGVYPEERPWLFVIKKNKSVLTRLLEWLHRHVADSKDSESGRPLVTRLPLLVIDDEADNASVDTGEKVIGEDGEPDLEHEPTAINRLIRSILHTFTRKAYVGYTATPFANIFIHEQGSTALEGPDLFPAAFIKNLAAPSSYVGPVRVFGVTGDDGRVGGLPLVREVEDYCSEDGKSGWMPKGHKSSHRPVCDTPEGMPASLVEAIHAFMLACTVRNLRGQGDEHSSMLIHVTRFNQVQEHVHRQVDDYVQHCRQRLMRRLDHAPLLQSLRALWERDFLPTATDERLQETEGTPANMPAWADIEQALPLMLEELKVRMINGKATDILDYADSPTGLKVIAVGGDKLARGLTLEGLLCSYFLRASRMYDTLMQMGRWFGYRPGYLDLCRLYTTTDLVEWFEHITDAAEELREEFDLMQANGGTPRDFGLKVRSHPTLMVTSRLKMRSAKAMMLSFSGSLVETVAFFREQQKLERNLAAFNQLIERLGPAGAIPRRSGEAARGCWWTGVPATEVLGFLDNYVTHPESYKTDSRLLASFIEAMSLKGELTHWNIALLSGGARPDKIAGREVNWLKRSANKELVDRYAIGRLLSPGDEAFGLSEQAWQAALTKTREAWHADAGSGRKRSELPDAPNGPAIRHVRGFGSADVAATPETGLLLLALLDPQQADMTLPDVPVAAFAISFPGSHSGVAVKYMANNVFWETEFGACE